MQQRSFPRLVLASGSVSRRALLVAAGLTFAVQPAEVDEGGVKRDARTDGANATSTALRLARLKAEVVARRDPEALVIGADQLLVCEGVWFDKPASVAAAAEQLRLLRGRTHELITAAACYEGGRCQWHHVAMPRLTMRQFSDDFLETYLAAEGEAVTACVGAYRLEGLGMHLFDAIEGEHAAILGLPMLALLGFLRDHGIIIQ